MSASAALTRRAPWAWAGAGVLVGTLLALLFFAPARWLASAVQQASDGRVLLQDARGTLWAGSAALTLSGGAGSRDATTLPSRMDWQLRPQATGVLVRLSAPCCLPTPWVWQLQPRWGGASLALSDAVSNWPAQMLAGLGTPFNTLDLHGQMALQPSGLRLGWVAGRLQLDGQLQLQLQNLSSRLSTLQPLGSYQLRVSGGATPSLQLATLAGPLQLSGSGQWIGGKWQFRGAATSEAQYQTALANLLNIIGRRSGARSVITLG